ncbi:PHA/PHB synthase family protein [Jannaschia seohaensis]|uniref:Polyhydroxyalkanoate synthase n=1 Tax=Jannaschia seohaensis TaxID=475081 RepID=A0A2Y9A0E6_9RHOB|nr:class I poly(R)-hydroxyalkanoic acid synthase [Jannaschia seohaensis]PWJ21642.1 polyhydroxyalkanoate synthase [Jannaschia seohaensis]SSA37920.1 polyhydroxyalkanoate synthase [Jannaschia seohaensis]
MPAENPDPELPDVAETAQRMMALTQRSLAAAAKMQSRSVAQATGSEYQLMDAATLTRAYANVWARALTRPQDLMAAQLKATTGLAQAWQAMLMPREGEVKDRRFKDESWSSDPLSRSYRDAFLAFEGAVEELLETMTEEGRDDLRVKFFTRQAVSALSPANYLATNAAARAKMLESGGQSVLDGLDNLLTDLERGDGRLAIATNDGQAYKVGVDLATTEGEVVFQNDLMQLIQYHPRTETQYQVPMLFVPAWINKFYIMDMRPQNSLIRYALDQGHSVFVISWANPTKAHADLDFTDYMTKGPIAALDVIRDITGEEKANVLGFCIGGILVTAMLGYLAAKGDDRINSATTLATMVDFADVGEIGVFIDDDRLEVLRAHMEEKGYLDAHHLQDMFSMLRENDLIWSFYDANYLRGDKPRPFDLLYWNSDSTRLPKAMLLWYLEEIYLRNKLRQPGGLEMDGVKIDISKIKPPLFVLATEDDHIAPWRSIYPATQIMENVEFVLGGSGHIAGVINPPGKRMKYGYKTATHYPETAVGFLRVAESHEGSWWPHWVQWLDGKSGAQVPARKVARRGRYKSLEPAPGSFVTSKPA